MRGSSVGLQQQLDQQLKNQYHEICFNPTKRDILHRLIADPAITPPIASDRNLNPVQINNHMLQEYINSIYDHYGIEDPIRREFRLAKRSLDLPAQYSPEKSLNQTQITESDRLTRTKRKLINLKESFKRDSSDIVYSSQLIQGRPNGNSSPSNRSRLTRQIGYRTKEKIHFKTLPREQGLRQIPKPKVRQEFVVDNTGRSKVVIRFSNTEQQIRKEVPVIFRYCPMCEVPVLDSNIYHHQNQCKDIQIAYRMPYNEIQAIIMHKIRRLESEISNEFVLKEQRKASEQFSHLKQSVRLWIDQGDSRSLEKVKDGFQTFACSTYQKINKLNWFKRLYKTVAKKRSLESALK